MQIASPTLSKTSDHLGTTAGLLCAVHCLAAPLILAAAPALGSVWTSPWAHWAFASVSIPAALLLLRRGLRHHGRRWVMLLACSGVALLLVGLMAPGTSWASSLGFRFSAPDWLPGAAPLESASSTGCSDECCASVQISGSSKTVTLPFASWITMLGGFALVVSHLANLRLIGCANCRS